MVAVENKNEFTQKTQSHGNQKQEMETNYIRGYNAVPVREIVDDIVLFKKIIMI